MKMTRYFTCCEKCFQTIEKRNSKAANAWMHLCLLHLTKGLNLAVFKDKPEIRALEILGFIVSTDFQTSISIKIKGHIMTDDGEHFFCAKGGHHD